MNTSRFHFVRVGIAVVSACAALSGCRQADKSPELGEAGQPIAKGQPTTPTSVKVERRDIVGYALMEGELLTPPTARAEVFATYRAPVERVLTSEGQRVRKGDVLIDLAEPATESYFAQAKATLDAARSAMTTAEMQFNAPVREAERVLSRARATERTLRSTTMPGGDASQLNQAIVDRQQAEEALIAARANARIELLPYRQQLQAAQAAYDEARSGVRRANLTAPISGVVTRLSVQVGQEVGASRTALAEIVDLSALQVVAEVPSARATLVDEGTDVVLIFNEFPNQHFDGRVTSITPLPSEAAGKVYYEAMIAFANDDGLIKPGMGLKYAGVETGRTENTLAVPVDAIAKDASGKPIVRKLVAEAWTQVVVDPGLSDGTFVAIKSGDLKEGDTVQVVPGQGAWVPRSAGA